MIGQTLSHYKIIEKLGQGGMGEVYLAEDSRLNRKVALKILPQHLSEKAERRERFEREARAVSSLNHPNICTLYDIGEQDGIHYLVMEHLVGETLEARLSKGPLPLEQTLEYAIQIADALGKAHQQGVVHRDLKPGNIMLVKSGAKLLDFGLAKLQAADTPTNLSALPTEQANLTAEGTILGTLQYMAPEQLEAKEADSRTDIFAFGAVVYEMATGKKAFEGESQASLIAAIMGQEPRPMEKLQPMTPPTLDHVVRRCMSKAPEDRWQAASDVMAELKWVTEVGTQEAIRVPATGGRKHRERLGWIVAVILLVVALVLVVPYFLQVREEVETLRFYVDSPPGTRIASGPAAPNVAVSPDGRLLALVTVNSAGQSQLRVHPLDSLEARILPGTEGAAYPFWSPDSRFLGFFAQGEIKKVEVSGEPPQKLCNVPGQVGVRGVASGQGGTWSRDGVIVFSSQEGLYRVSASGGNATSVTTLDPSGEQTSHMWPHFLPDDRHFLYLAMSAQSEVRGVYLGSLDSNDTERLLDTEVRAIYAPPGYLLFLREGTLLAQSFDAKSLRLMGEPVPIPGTPAYNPEVGRTTFSASETGVLVYRAGTAGGVETTQLTWFDREGKSLDLVTEPGIYRGFWPSQDEERILLAQRDFQTGRGDIWLVDSSRNTSSRFTFDSSDDLDPLWSPDGSKIVFSSDRSGHRDLYQKTASGTGEDYLLLESDQDKTPTDWSADGQFIVYESIDPKTGEDLWVLPLSGDQEPISFLNSEFREDHGQLSPDGRWMAYTSNESGRTEVYVRAFPDADRKSQVSTNGGKRPKWRSDGKELFYLAVDNKLLVVDVDTQPTFEAGVPRPLFQAKLSNVPLRNHFAVSADGQRFLMLTLSDQGAASRITVVTNWTAELGQ